MRRKWRALAGKALDSLSSFDWVAEPDRRSAVPVLYRTMKRSVDVSGVMPPVFIFNAVASGTVLELAALAAAATSVMLCADGVEAGAAPLSTSPPHAASASDSEMQALPESVRPVVVPKPAGPF
jgi:hypothetical protein